MTTPHAASTIGIKALRRKVRRHKRATINVFVSPCNGRKGEPVKLFRGRRHVASAHLSLACTVTFRPRITHKVAYRAEIAEDATYVAATSRNLHILIDHSKPKSTPRRRSRLRTQPPARDPDEGAPGRLRVHARAFVEEADRIAEVAGEALVLPGEPVDALQVQLAGVGDQVGV